MKRAKTPWYLKYNYIEGIILKVFKWLFRKAVALNMVIFCNFLMGELQKDRKANNRRAIRLLEQQKRVIIGKEKKLELSRRKK